MTKALISSFRGLQAAAASHPVAPALSDFAPLEPRMLMDASLSWALDGASDAADALTGLHRALELQLAHSDDFSAAIEAMLSPVLQKLQNFNLSPAGDPDFADKLEQISDRLRAAFTEIRDSSQDRIDLLTDGLIPDAEDTAAFTSLVSALNASLADADPASHFTSGDLTAFFASVGTAGALLGTAGDQAIATLAQTMNLRLEGAVGVDALEDLIRDTVITQRLTLNSTDFTLELNDITDGDETAVRFSAINGSDDVFVTVQIALPDMGIGYDNLIRDVLGIAALPFDLAGDPASAPMLEFTLGAYQNGPFASGLQIFEVSVQGLGIAGGAVDLSQPYDPDTEEEPGPWEIQLGLLTLDVTSVTLAELQVVTNQLGYDFGTMVTYTPDGYVFSAGSADIAEGILTAGLMLRPVGGDPALIAVEEGESYDLIAMSLAGQLDLLSDEGTGFEIDLGISAILSPASQTVSSPAERMSAFLNGAHLSFEVTPDSSVTSPVEQALVIGTVSGLAAMQMSQITGFLTDVGDTIAGMLRSSMLNVEIPFTTIELSSVLRDLATAFDNLDKLFLVDAHKIGFSTQMPLLTEISGPVTSRSADFDPSVLAGVDQLEFTLVGASGETKVLVELGDLFIAPAGTVAEQTAALAELLTEALAAYGFAASASGSELRIGSNTGQLPASLLALTGARGLTAPPPAVNSDAPADGQTPGDGDTPAPPPAPPVSLALLGFGQSEISEVPGSFSDASAKALLLHDATQFTFKPGATFADEMAGVNKLVFEAGYMGISFPVHIDKPAEGWTINGEPNLEGLQAAFETALARNGLPLELVVEDGAFIFSSVAAPGETITFGAVASQMVRAFDLSGLIDWVNVRLSNLEILNGARLELTQDGALIFTFPDVSLEKEISGYFDLSDIGLDQLSNLELSARLQAAISASFTTGVGIDIVGFARDLMAAEEPPEEEPDSDPAEGGDGGSAPEPVPAPLKPASENALQGRRDYEKTDSSGAGLGTAVLNNIFFADFALAAQISGSAGEIKGRADLGLMELTFGRDNAALNFLEIDTQFDFTLVGRDTEGAFSERVSLNNILDAFMYRNAAGEMDVLRGLNGLVGRTDLQGGIVTNGGAGLLDANGDVTILRNVMQKVDADAHALQEGEVLSQLYLQLNDVRLNVAGIQGLNEGIIDGLALSIDDLTSPLESLNWRLLGDGAEAFESLSTLGTGDLLDSFEVILNIVSVTGHALKEKLPFLAHDIPLLNFSVLDAVDFAEDLTKQIKELRDDPMKGLAKLEQVLEKVFGQDTVTLTWDTDLKTLGFALEFSFLRDFAQSLPFNFDLDALIGDQLASIVGEDAARILTNLADVEGDGNLIFDPDLTMTFAFGLDLSEVLKEAPIASRDTLLSELSTVSAIVHSAEGSNDLRIRWKDATDDRAEAVNVDIAGITTLGALIDKINSQLASKIGDHVSLEFDAETGVLTLVDTNADLVLVEGVTALFGAEESLSSVDEDEGKTFLSFDPDFDDYAGAYSFRLAFGADEESLGESIEIAIEAKSGRTAAGFVEALNEALAAADIDRRDISSRSVSGWSIPVSQLLTAELVDGVIQLIGTNFATTIGADDPVFKVSGIPAGHDVTFELLELGGSNAARLIGFATGQVLNGSMASAALGESTSIGAPRLFLNTEVSGLKLSFKAGAEDGLNLKLGFGPVSIAVVDGTALISAGADSTEAAYLAIGFNDVDETPDDGQYNLSDLFSIATDSSRSFADIFNVDVAIGVYIDFAFQDNFGFLDPDVHGISYKADLLTTDGPVTVSGTMLSAFRGDLINLFNGDDLEGTFELNLPSIDDITSFFTEFNILDLLNDPAQILNGLDMILARMQELFDKYLKGIELPVVGNAISSAVTFFTDFRLGALAEAREFANTPLEDGSLPTTVYLLQTWLNEKLGALFNIDVTENPIIQVHLNSDGSFSDSYIYGALNINAVIFDQVLDIGFDLGLPGFELAVKESSGIRIALDYSINLGFGFNKNGFFLLNDTDDKEVRIGILADAGTFQGSAKLMSVLGISADAVTKVGDEFIGYDNALGTAIVTADLGVDLYGEQGLKIISAEDAEDGKPKSDEIVIDLSGISPRSGAGQELSFERLIYLTKISSKDLVKFAFNADVDIQIALKGNILDPSKEGFSPLKVGGYEVIPSVKTELIIQGGYDSASGDGFVFDRVGFENVRIDANVLYNAIIRPVIEPIMGFIEPLADALGWMQEVPFKFVVDALSSAFPIFGIVSNVLGIIKDIADFVEMLEESGGEFSFGDFDFSNSFKGDDATNKLDTSSVKTDVTKSAGNVLTGGGKQFGVFGSLERGIALELPLLTDPFSAINILLGKYEMVDLIKVHFTLLNLELPRTDFVRWAIESMGLPGFVASIITGGLQFEIGAKAFAGISVGYDLSGIVNFVNTHDPMRLLDGIFLSTKPFIDIGFEVAVGLNLGIVGILAGGGAALELGFNDPNDDGKLKIPELVAIINASNGDFGKLLGYLFEGKFSVNFFLSVWVYLNFGIFSIDIDIDVFKFDKTFNFGGADLPPRVAPDVADGGTATLSIGSNIGNSLSDLNKDGDDVVTISGPHSPLQLGLQNEQGGLASSLNEKTGGIIIPAGKGNNTINLSELGTDIPIVIYADDGNDKVMLPDQGLIVVFLGDGYNQVTGNPGATGTYVIFGGSDEDVIDIPSGNVVYFGEGDYGMRDVFLAAFSDNGGDSKQAGEDKYGDRPQEEKDIPPVPKPPMTKAAVEALLGITADGQVDLSENAAKNYSITNAEGKPERVTLAQFLEDYTVSTQIKAGTSADTVTTGAGNALIMTGGGNDIIRAGIGGTGVVKVYSGAGADQITIGGNTAFVEAGAGADLVISEVTGSAEIWGWGKAAGAEGQLAGDSETAKRINQLAMRDEADVLIGGSGADKIYGQMGNDVIEGGLGADQLFGGRGTDLVTGGTFVVTGVKSAEVIDLTTYHPLMGFNQAVYLTVQNQADGSDTLSGGSGDDILLGGGGADSLTGGLGADILVGDFASVKLSTNLIAERVETQFDDSEFAGNDSLNGNEGNDILIGGGRSETIEDLAGNNVIIADFGMVQGARLNAGVSSFGTWTEELGGDDSITTGDGNDYIIGGVGDDTIRSGGGNDAVIGDDGMIWLLGNTDGSVTAVLSAYDISAGDDVIYSGSGDNRIIGGLGDDEIILGAGNNVVIGDTGRIDENSATGDWLETDGDDSVSVEVIVTGQDSMTGDDTLTGEDPETVTEGRNRVIGNGGADIITLGNGGHRVIGDAGSISWLGLTNTSGETMSSLTPLKGGNDTIETGSGHDVIFGGAGDELIRSGAGHDVVLGDNGAWGSSTPTSEGYARGEIGENAGHDVIYGGEGNDIIIGGQGDDTLYAGSGEDLVLGDSGAVRFIGITELAGFELSDIERGGDDLIEVDITDTSDDILVGQAGHDLIRAGAGDDVIIGDNALFTFFAPANALPGQTGADRLIRIESLRMTGPEGNDTLYGRDGNDIIIAGFGDDLLYGGKAQDMLVGDSAIITRRWEDADKGGLTEWTTIETNFAFETGGYDILRGEEGNDVMIGNLGPDLFYGDTAEDAIFSDGYAGLFRAWLPLGFAAEAENDQRYLYTSNFAGQGAVDVVSNAQQNASIGNALTGQNDDRGGKVISFAGKGQHALDPDLWRRSVDMLEKDEVLQGLSWMLAMDVPEDLLAGSLMATLIEAGLISAGTDPIILEMLINRLLEVLAVKQKISDAQPAGTLLQAAE